MLRGAIRAGLALWAISAASPGAASARELTREEAVARALEDNPEIQSLQAEVDAARIVLGAARIPRFNPQAEGAAGPRWSPDGRTVDFEVGVSQELEVAGQPVHRSAAARAALAAAEARLAARRADLTAQVRGAFGALQAAEQRVRLAEEARDLAEDALRAAEERFRAGEASRIEVNTSRAEVGRSARDRAHAQREQAAALAELKLLLALPADEDLAAAGELAPAAGAETPRLEDLLVQATTRADLAAARAERDAAVAGRRLASAEGAPNPTVGVTYGEEEGAATLRAGLSLPLPLFDRNQAGRGEARARATQAELALATAERRVQQEVRVALARYQAAVAAAQAFGDEVLSALEENLRIVNEAYRAGEIDFLQLLLVRRETLEGRRAWIDALEELNRAQAELDRAIGRTE